jgi:hypothetical protein
VVHKSKLILLAGLLGGTAYAGTLTLETSAIALGANDTVLWGQLGSDSTALSNTFSATSAGSLSVGGSFSASTGEVVDVGASWGPANGSFADGDAVLWANDGNSGTGPISLTFPTVRGAGASIQYDVPNVMFTATLQLFNGGSSLGSVSETSDAAGDAIFIGALDTVSEVTRALFSVTPATTAGNPYNNPSGDFALDTLNLTTPSNSPSAPEPGSVFLFGCGMVALFLTLRRRLSRC